MADDRDDHFQDSYAAGRSDDPDRWPANEEGPQGLVDTPKTGKSSAVKVLLIVLAVLVIGAILCCGGFGLYFYSNPPIQTTENPDEVKQKTSGIVEIDLPADFQPVMAIDMNMFIMTMQMTAYEAQGNGMLMLAQVQAPTGADEAQMQQQIRQSMQQQNMGEQLTVKESETKTIEIDGNEVEFLFSTAANARDQSEWRQVNGAFPGKNGTAFLILQQPADSFDEEEVTQMLESISTE